MVFCNTLGSSRAVDHFLNENQVSTVNYHGEVPAEQRVENLNKFKSNDGDCPTLVCTDLAARGLDLAVDHVIMFDFPLTPIDYLHRTGRTARMGAKGKVTSLVTKKDIILACQIEDAIRKNESLEVLATYKEKLEERKKKQIHQKLKENVKSKEKTSSLKGTKIQRTGRALTSKSGSKAKKASVPKMPKINSQKAKQVKFSVTSAKKKQAYAQKNSESSSARKVKGKSKVWETKQALTSRLSVVGFKGKQKS
uniref:TSA: Wollemia nobilis Ref_Wollemi_Transcript_19326_976 transcribed RNA sequence n=1 Tax=Wollemia nobilis TaxID=56998 RepID=A0A0C9RRG5_9CONI